MSLLSIMAIGLLAVLPFSGTLQANTESPPSPAPPPLPRTVDLRARFRRWKLEPRRQGARGTCSVFTVVGALEYAIASRQQAGTRLSVEFLNWAGHKAADRAADGGFFSEMWAGYEKYGICPEEDLPYRSNYETGLTPPDSAQERAKRFQNQSLRMHWIKEWDPQSGLNDAQLLAIKRTLTQRWPVCGGFRWPKRAQWVRRVLQVCPPEAVFDGHSVLLIGYRDDPAQPGGGVFLIRNSGGDGSDGYLPYAYVAAYMNDALWIEAPRDQGATPMP